MKGNELHQLVKEGKISMKTMERVNIAKSYIEKKYSLKKEKEEEKKKDWDFFNKKMEELNLSTKEKDLIKKDVLHKEAEYLRLKRKKISIKEFESISIIGRGAFGEVRVCRHIESGDIVAIKKMRKDDMLAKNQITHVRTEREILTNSKIPWIVNLRYSFQDEMYLYLVMDFLPGGDLMSLLMKKDILTEDEARFYIAELILAVESVHNMNCIHRDLKPDNILIDRNGHIQLSDFGLSKLADQSFYPMSTDLQKEEDVTMHRPNNNLISENKLSRVDIKTKRKNRLMAYSTVGTPDYIAPEVFGQSGYSQEVDWWSVGVILFEMIVGYPPFFSENPSETCQKIVKWKQYFSIPLDANLSLEAENLIRKLVTSPDQRLGLSGAEEIKRHPFFKGLDWKNVRNMRAPFIPDVKNEWDSKYFDTFPEQEPFYPVEKKQKRRKDINYPGYTYNRDLDNPRDGLLHALEVLEAVKQSTQNIDHKYEMVDDLKVTDQRGSKSSLDSQKKMITIEKETISKGNSKNSSQTQNNIDLNMKNIKLKENVKNTSPSPDHKIMQPNMTTSNISVNKIPTSTATASKIQTPKGINIIPIKNIQSHREAAQTSNNYFTNDRIPDNRFSPKPRDLKIPSNNLSPNQGQRSKLIPIANKNLVTGVTSSNQVGFDNKISNRILTNIINNINNKSPSPKHYDSSKITTKKSPEISYKK